MHQLSYRTGASHCNCKNRKNLGLEETCLKSWTKNMALEEEFLQHCQTCCIFLRMSAVHACFRGCLLGWAISWAAGQRVLMTMPATHCRKVNKQKLQKSIPLAHQIFSQSCGIDPWETNAYASRWFANDNVDAPAKIMDFTWLVDYGSFLPCLLEKNKGENHRPWLSQSSKMNQNTLW